MRVVLSVLVGVILTLGVSAAMSAPSFEAPPFVYNNGRFGFGLTKSAATALSHGWPTYLNAGWYWDWAARGATQLPPLQYIQTVHLTPVKSNNVQVGYTASPTGTALLSAINKQPGATWFIGNEPDCSTMDNMRSDWYARAYHDMYYLIKAADPTAKVAAGNIVQPTPQRFMYLDRILAAYQSYYGEPLPADLWSIHSYILCEKCYPYNIPSEPFAWGACWVPDWPSRSASESIATFYSVYDHWDINIFKERIQTFRQWMYNNGYRNHPLLIPEYGILFYEGLVYSGATYDAKSREFMYAGFDWMQSARDATFGYRMDDNRLVQGWAWYSLDHGDFPGGTLFDPYTYQPTAMGRDYAAYTRQVTPTVQLLTFDPYVATPVTETGAVVTATVYFTVSNAGNIASGGTSVAKVISNSVVSPTYYTVIGGTTIGSLTCCGDHETVTIPWPGYVVGANYDFYITILDIDLKVERLWSPIQRRVTTPTTATLYATLSNRGYSNMYEPLTVTFYYSGSIQVPLGNVVIPELGCCGNRQTVSMTWPNLTDGIYPFCMTASTTYIQTEPVCADVWINPPYTHYLPIVVMNSP
ncbi:MAG TPA: hypothetical protein PLJ78_06850 [Anaerolineae bacterium]|nr:hypothetical protein [Anaerolineae bacterium]HQK13645.1 hypothetical protein [Anaerolineae bacterium]